MLYKYTLCTDTPPLSLSRRLKGKATGAEQSIPVEQPKFQDVPIPPAPSSGSLQ